MDAWVRSVEFTLKQKKIKHKHETYTTGTNRKSLLHITCAQCDSENRSNAIIEIKNSV